MTRVVVDTNVLVSALLTQRGAPAQALIRIINDDAMQFCMSREVFAEYEEVLNRAKFGFTADRIELVLDLFRRQGLWVKPTEKVTAEDPKDDVFLECAAASFANFLITGNLRHFPKENFGTRIVTAREFLDLSHG